MDGEERRLSTTFDGFDLTGDGYWSDPLATQRDWSLRLSESDHVGLLLDAPPTIELTRRDRLPLVVAWATPLPAGAQTPFHQHALIAGVDQLRNHLRVAPVAELERWQRRPGDPSAAIPAGHMVSFQLADARERLGLPWEAGAWVFRVLLHEHVSNPRRVRLGDPQPVELDRATATPTGAPWPRFDLDAPALPGAGLRLDVPRVTPLRADPQLVLHGALRLPALPHERVVDPAPGDPQAVIEVSVLVTSSLGGRVIVEPLRVPCAGPPDDQGRYAGRFAVDLLPWVEPRSQTLFVHAFAGAEHAGPALAALVAAEDLPEVS